MIEKDDSFKWGTFHQDLSYHSNEMRPCSFYLRPNNLPLEIISEIRRRDLGLNDGKIGRKKINNGVLEKITSKVSRCHNKTKTKLSETLLFLLCPQDLTKWHSGLK